ASRPPARGSRPPARPRPVAPPPARPRPRRSPVGRHSGNPARRGRDRRRSRTGRACAPPRATRAGPAPPLGRGDARCRAPALLDPPPPRLILAVPADRPREPFVEGGTGAPAGQPRDLVGRADVPV